MDLACWIQSLFRLHDPGAQRNGEARRSRCASEGKGRQLAYVSSFKSQAVEKAKKPRAKWKASRTYKSLDALHRRMGSAVSIDLYNGITKFKKRIEPQKVYDAWVKGDWGPIMETIPWEHMKDDITPALEKGAGVLAESGKIVIQELPAPLQAHLRWDTKNPRVRDWIASRTAENFTRLTQDSATNIQRAVTASLNQSLTPRQVANRIKNSIGLLPRHAQAVNTYRMNLIAQGNPPSKAESLADKYADRLLDYRANMIGRTETRLATNQGQIAVWREASDQGLVDRHTTGKRWIVDGDPCEDCEVMDGVTVPLDGFFTMDDGTTIDFPPHDVHPHCFCGIEIVYELEPDDFD